MSIKRVKQVTRGPRDRDSSSTPWFASAKQPERQWEWATDVASQPEESFAPYAMTACFAAGSFLVHSKFGKGVVTHVEGPNIDVLFEEGPKRLRHSPVASGGSPVAK